MRTKVLCRGTGEIQIFHLPPQAAVVAAYEQARGNWTTWSYDYSRAKVECGGQMVCCGAFSARLTQTSIAEMLKRGAEAQAEIERGQVG